MPIDINRYLQATSDLGLVEEGITIVSFGILRRHMPPCNIFFDVRFIEAPHFSVDPFSPEYSAKLLDQYGILLENYATTIYFQHQDSGPVTAAIGCNEGRHRSVAVAEILRDIIPIPVRVKHLDR